MWKPQEEEKRDEEAARERRGGDGRVRWECKMGG
jgi:hypothetical protein